MKAVKVTVLDKKLFADLQQLYCANPQSGACDVYETGDEYLFINGNGKNHFWNMGLDSLVKTSGDPKKLCGGPNRPFCAEAWDAISRYIYAAQEGGKVMPGWMKEDNVMITCCNDGTRPVIFKIEAVELEEDGSIKEGSVKSKE